MHRPTRNAFRSTSTTLLIAAAGSLLPALPHTPAAAQDRSVASDFTEVCRVGGPTAPEWAFFEAASSVDFDGAGNLHILETGAERIVVVGPECNLVRTVGRKGEGPGEFNQALMLAVWRDGRVAVMDLGHTAYQIFGPGGEFERSVRMGSDQGPMAMFSGVRLAIRADPAGDALIAQGSPSSLGRMSTLMAQMMGGGGAEEEGVDDRGLERLDLSDEMVAATPVLQGWRAPREAAGDIDPANMTNPAALIGNLMGDQFGFEPGFHWDLLPDGTMVWSDSTAYAIKFAGPGGSVSDVVERPISPELVTARIRQETIARTLAEMEKEADDPRVAQAHELAAMMPGIETAVRKAIEEMEFHDEVPVVRGLKTTWEGGVWVRRRGDEPWDDEGPIDVFGPGRAYVGTLDASGAEMPAAFGPGGLAAYWEVDEFDVPALVLKRLPEGVR